jgi:putative transposase
MSQCMLGGIGANRSLLVVETQKGPSMRFVDSIFGELLKPIDRRWFQSVVDRCDGDAYDKSFKSWDHIVALIFAQLGGAESLRAVEAGFNANANHHYHLGVGPIARSTLSDANARRPVEIFAQTFTMLAATADRQTRHEGAEMVRLIDSSPVPLGKTCGWAEWNGRIRGMKMHVVYDPNADCPRCVEITPATVNDVESGRGVDIEPGAAYVFDKGYCHFGWWKKIHDAGALFVTHAKRNTRLRIAKRRYVRKIIGDGFRIIDDAEVVSPARAIPGCRSRSAASASGATTAPSSPSSPTISTEPRSRSRRSTRPAGKSNCCFAGSSSISTSVSSSGATKTPSACKSSPP